MSLGPQAIVSVVLGAIFRTEGMLGHDLLNHIQSKSPTISGVNLPKEWLLILLEDLQLLAIFAHPVGARRYEAFTPLFRPDSAEDRHFYCNDDIASKSTSSASL